MDYNKLLDFAVDIGYELSMCGAETYRVEESIVRVLAAYGEEAEVYAIPNSITVSITRPDGKPLTRMRRVGFHGNNLDGVEVFSNLCRKICTQSPDADTAYAMLAEAKASMKAYAKPLILLGYFLGAAGFSLFFGGGLLDGFIGGLAGVAAGICQIFADKYKANKFFGTILASFMLAMVPYAASMIGLCPNSDAATAGAVMTLIPGLLFTYAMRDIIFGDTNSGVNRIVQVILIALGIACGTCGAWSLVSGLWHAPVSAVDIDYRFWQECVAGCMIGCLGFSILFNIHRMGILFGSIGGIISWGAYCITEALGGDAAAAMLISSAVAAIYAEVMARIRKCPAIGYLVLSLIPLIPGSSLYYATTYMVRGHMQDFGSKGKDTVLLTCMMAVGILLVSTTVRMWNVWKFEHRKK